MQGNINPKSALRKIVSTAIIYEYIQQRYLNLATEKCIRIPRLQNEKWSSSYGRFDCFGKGLESLTLTSFNEVAMFVPLLQYIAALTSVAVTLYL